MRRQETKEEIERKQKWATERSATAKPEDINFLLGRIRENAERIVRRPMMLTDREVATLEDAQRILELIEQAQKVVLEAQLSASLKAVQK